MTGRQQGHPEMAEQVLKDVLGIVTPLWKDTDKEVILDKDINLEGRNFWCVISLHKKKKDANKQKGSSS